VGRVARARGRSTDVRPPRALCSLEYTLRHEPQRACGVHLSHAAHAMQAGHFSLAEHSEHGRERRLEESPVRDVASFHERLRRLLALTALDDVLINDRRRTFSKGMI